MLVSHSFPRNFLPFPFKNCGSSSQLQFTSDFCVVKSNILKPWRPWATLTSEEYPHNFFQVSINNIEDKMPLNTFKTIYLVWWYWPEISLFHTFQPIYVTSSSSSSIISSSSSSSNKHSFGLLRPFCMDLFWLHQGGLLHLRCRCRLGSGCRRGHTGRGLPTQHWMRITPIQIFSELFFNIYIYNNIYIYSIFFFCPPKNVDPVRQKLQSFFLCILKIYPFKFPPKKTKDPTIFGLWKIYFPVFKAKSVAPWVGTESTTRPLWSTHCLRAKPWHDEDVYSSI